jgi:hypothetical protein
MASNRPRFKEVPEHHAQVPDVGWVGPAGGEDDFRSGESIGLDSMVVALVAPLSQADVSAFGRRNYGICRCCTKIAVRLVNDSAMRVGLFCEPKGGEPRLGHPVRGHRGPSRCCLA